MKVEILVESVETELDITKDQALALLDVGRRLASNKTWWGQVAEEDAEEEERTVVRVRPSCSGQWDVRIADAVGVIAVPDLQLIVRPKIPTSHLLYLFAQSGAFPRLDPGAAALAPDPSLWQLVAEWYVGSVERLLRADLVRDYSETSDLLVSPAGRIEPTETARHYYSGDLSFACTFDRFSTDTPLNRVIRAAATSVVESPLLTRLTRGRSLRILARMDEVGPLRARDLTVALERRSRHYAQSLALARHVLGLQGRTLLAGGQVAWSFLVRTPDIVELGIRAVLQQLPVSVEKTARVLVDSGNRLTINPDLVFSAGAAVGDVKYKLSPGQWTRSDLYQVVAFAAAYRASRAVLVRFRDPGVKPLSPLSVGDITVAELTWLADEQLRPEQAAAALVHDAENLLLWLLPHLSQVV